MVKTPRTRHSKTGKEPVTIDLQPGEVSRVKAEAETTSAKTGEASATTSPESNRPSVPPASSKPSASTSAASTSAGTSAAANTKPSGSSPTGSTDPVKPATSADITAKPTGSSSTAEPSKATAETPKTSGTASSGSSQFGRQEAPRASASSSTPPNQPAQQPTAQKPSRGGALAAGVAGGVIALVLGAGLQMAGLLPGPRSATQERDPAISSLEAEMVQLREQISALGAGAGGEAPIGERVTQAEERLATLASEVETLRSAAPQPGDGQTTDISPLEERIAAIEGAIASIGDAATPEANLAAVDDQIAALREDIATAREGQSAAVTRLDALEQSVEGLTGRVDEQAETPGTAVIIAASALKAAIDRGTPFMTELETFATLAPDAAETAELRDLAARGVPTSADIASEADAAANAMIAASRPVDPQASVVDRLWGSAMGLVQVRPVGMVEGEGVPETVARIDAAIGANDYARAVTEFDTLPDAAKAAGESFMTKVRAREAADRLIDQALAAALKA